MSSLWSLERTVPFSLELLEDRTVPALFGLPWPDSTHLTVSFAPDGTEIAGHSSNLFASLDSRMDRAVWQGAMLRALQTWAVTANIDFGVVADGGRAFGTAGPVQGDERFGDVRIGAQAMTEEAFAVSIPFDPVLSGSWAGDLLVNSRSVVDQVALFRVALHEAGHILGLGPSNDPNSPMFNRFGSQIVPTADDIAALRRLYGARRPDANEGRSGNDTMRTATRIKYSESSDGYTGATPLVNLGDLTTNQDTDYFWLEPLTGYAGPVTLRVQTAELSLMAPTLTVFDERGRVLGQSSATGSAGGFASVTLNTVNPNLTYYARVTSRSGDVFGIGRYALITTFDGRNTVGLERTLQVVRNAPTTIESDDLNELFITATNPWADDAGTNDTKALAFTVKPTLGPDGEARYSTLGSIAQVTDTDFYRLKMPKQPSNASTILTVSLRAGAFNGIIPRVELLDASQRSVTAEVLVNGDGSYTLQAKGLSGGTDYFLKVSGGGRTGNYSLTALAGIQAIQRTTFATNTLGTTPQSYAFFVAQTQLFQFTLSTQAVGNATGGLRMEIRDSTNNLVLSLNAAPGETITASSVLLSPGAYRVTFVRDAGATGSLLYTLKGASLSDPIGPVLGDPTLTPQYLSPTDPSVFLYPGGLTWDIPFVWVLLDPAGPLVLPGIGTGHLIGPGGTIIAVPPGV